MNTTKIESLLKSGMSVRLIAEQAQTTPYEVNKIRAILIANGEIKKGKAQLKAHKTRKVNAERLLNKAGYEPFRIKAGATLYVKRNLLAKVHAMLDGNFIIE